MAFNVAYLSSLGVDQFHTQIWTAYVTDGITSVDGSGYFNAASDRLSIGDIIIVKRINDLTKLVTRDFTLTSVSIHAVNGNSAGVVDVSNNLLGAWSDTD